MEGVVGEKIRGTGQKKKLGEKGGEKKKKRTTIAKKERKEKEGRPSESNDRRPTTNTAHDTHTHTHTQPLHHVTYISPRV